MNNYIDLKGKLALITGGCRGIGKEITLTLAKAGATVIVLDLELNGDFKERLKEISEKNEIFKGSVRDLNCLNNIKEKILRDHKGLDILVNNAGIMKVSSFKDISLDEIKELFEVNVYGVMNCVKIFGGIMTKNKSGKIINIASTDAQVGTSGHNSELGVENVVVYSSTKGAIISFTKSLAVEWGKYNINVNAISPILVETPMTKHLFEDLKKLKEYKKGLPLGKNPSMKDIANAVIYLSSNLSNSVTGHILNVDCGYLANSMRE